MSRKLSVKLILAGLWLLCYLPYKKALLVGEDDRVSSLLGNVQSPDNIAQLDFGLRHFTSLETDDINSSSWVKYPTINPGDSQFTDGLAKLEVSGLEIQYDDEDFFKMSISDIHFSYGRLLQNSSFRPLLVHLDESGFVSTRPNNLLKN